jgi:BetI-type transcriptional repressor, C-terminal
MIQAFIERDREEAKALFDAVSDGMGFWQSLDRLIELRQEAMARPLGKLAGAMWPQVAAEAVINPAARALLTDYYAYATGRIARLISAGQERGEISPVPDAEDLARAFVAISDGLELWASLDADADVEGPLRALLEPLRLGLAPGKRKGAKS